MINKLDRYLMVIATFFWAGAFIAGKFSVKEFPPSSLTFLRFFFASLVIFPILIKKEENWKIERSQWKTFIVLGIVGMVGYHILFFKSLKYTTAVNSSLIGATNPIITTILAVIFLKEKIKFKNIISILVSFVGVVLIITNGSIDAILNFKINMGDILMIVAVVCWAIYSILSKKASISFSPIKITSYAFLVCVIVLTPFFILEKPWIYIPKTTVRGWLSILYMSIFASVGGYLIQQISIKNIGPSRTSLYVNLIPVFSMILAFFILGEKIILIKVFAGLLIGAGVFLNSKSSNEKLENKA